MGKTSVTIALFVSVALFAASREVAASPTLDKGGWTFGLHAGYGHLTVASGLEMDCGSTTCLYDANALSVDLRGGRFITPRFAALAEIWMVIAPDDFSASGQAFYTAAAQYWPTRRLWLKGGLGLAMANLQKETATVDRGSIDFVVIEEKKYGAAGFAAVGYDITGHGRFAVDIQARLGLARYEGDRYAGTNFGLGVGFNWY